MTDWPTDLTVSPLREWPGNFTAERTSSPFRVTGLRPTLTLLRRELDQLAAEDVELLVAIAPEQFRLDGRPRAGAIARHPGVVLSFTNRLGRFAYPCDRFTDWQDNLRAIALALEALRKVDRYGVTTHGEQYRGFLALEPGTGDRPDDAIAELIRIAGRQSIDAWPKTSTELRFLIHQAKRRAHPDTGGSPDAFDRVTRAERTLRSAGRVS